MNNTFTIPIQTPLQVVWYQPLDIAIDEFTGAVEKLKTKLPQLSTKELVDVVLELKRLGQPQQVK